MNVTSTAPSGSEDVTSLSFEEGVSAIENLLSGVPEKDSSPADEAEPELETEVEQAEEEPELEIDVEPEVEAESEDKGPAVLSDSTLVTLDDGTTITLAELKTNNMFQRKFTQKTEELARTRDALEQEYRKKAEQIEADIAQKRDVVLKLYNEVVPKEPVWSDYQDVNGLPDEFGYLLDKARYDAKIKEISAVLNQREAETQAQQQEREAREQEFLRAEQQKLYEAIPAFKSQEKLAEFRKDIQSIAVPTYEIPLEMFNGLQDHRMVRILRDAILYQKALSKVRNPKPETTQAAKPKLEPKQRMSNTDIRDRTIAEQRQTLRKTGDFDTAAKLIESLI